MKTPRQLLLQRHQAAEPKLDHIRTAALRQLSHSSNGLPDLQMRFNLLTALLSFRWHLAGMSAVWLFVALLNTERSSAPTIIARQPAPSAQQIVVALREHRRQLLELIEPSFNQPLPVAPSRRSALQLSTVLA